MSWLSSRGRWPQARRDGDASRSAGSFIDAAADREDLDQAGDGKHPQYLLLRRGQQQVQPGACGTSEFEVRDKSRKVSSRGWRSCRSASPGITCTMLIRPARATVS
jgi:hypothetical protein